MVAMQEGLSIERSLVCSRRRQNRSKYAPALCPALPAHVAWIIILFWKIHRLLCGYNMIAKWECSQDYKIMPIWVQLLIDKLYKIIFIILLVSFLFEIDQNSFCFHESLGVKRAWYPTHKISVYTCHSLLRTVTSYLFRFALLGTKICLFKFSDKIDFNSECDPKA